jgi:hypothetical protein
MILRRNFDFWMNLGPDQTTRVCCPFEVQGSTFASNSFWLGRLVQSTAAFGLVTKSSIAARRGVHHANKPV